MPLVNKWKEELKTMVMKALKYLEDEDVQMHEVSKNILTFYMNLGEKYDINRDWLKQTDMSYWLSLAKCGDICD